MDASESTKDGLRDIPALSKKLAGILWRNERGVFLGLLFLGAALAAIPFINAGARGYLINQLGVAATDHTIPSSLALATGLLILAGFISPTFYELRFFFIKKLWFSFETLFQIDIAKKKGSLDVATHENPKHNDLFNRVRENGLYRIHNFTDRQFFIVQSILEILFSVTIIVVISPVLLVILVLASMPELVTEVRYGKEVWGIWGAKSEVRRRFWSINQHLDRLSSIIELKLFQNVGHFIELIRSLLVDFQKEQIRAEKRKLIAQIIGIICSQLAIGGAIVWLVLQTTQGAYQIGTFLFFISSIAQLRQSLSSLFGSLGRQYQDGLFVRDVFRLLDLPPTITSSTHPIRLSPEKTPTITFENVSFSYPGSDRVILANISLEIPPGEKLAIVGANGAGKTTFVKLLCRFYDPTGGRILIDGHDIKTIDLESYYALLGALFQEYGMYDFVVKDLIALGRTSTPKHMDRVERAAAESESASFIKEWDKGYDQLLGKQFTDGVEPSIGQWQKLALARTFYRDARILILDEPTSSIDAEAEAKIFEKLEHLPSDRTALLISHRFSTVRQASRICVLEDGTISELGSHKELLANNKTYARLFRMQAKGYQ